MPQVPLVSWPSLTYAEAFIRSDLVLPEVITFLHAVRREEVEGLCRSGPAGIWKTSAGSPSIPMTANVCEPGGRGRACHRDKSPAGTCDSQAARSTLPHQKRRRAIVIPLGPKAHSVGLATAERVLSILRLLELVVQIIFHDLLSLRQEHVEQRRRNLEAGLAVDDLHLALGHMGEPE
jgi:hypothetical protein